MNVTISQAMASGLPVIATRHSGLPDQVHDGVNGFLVPEGDYQALAEKIIEMIQHPELWPAFGQAGRKIVEEKFNNEKIIQKQIDIYKEVLNGDQR